ncbi:thiamine pyrophosphate-dependent enzyme [Natronorubrum sp. FCH18a]|uniref:thiamine pyrophosphate-dependent enzyme n=1 Tax=Natronorubrum sp. FCH18a TaxID=3447018 RepID=UPI003F513780
MSDGTPKTADQIACTRRLLDVTPDAVLVSNLGVASYVLAGVADRERNFYQWGSMGVTMPVGLGLALVSDEHVTVLEGDGSLLMSLGELTTVAQHNLDNLTVVVWDNETYATTGGQPTRSSAVDFVGVAESCGVHATEVHSTNAFETAYRNAITTDGTSMIVCRVDPVDSDDRPPIDYPAIARRVRDTIADDPIR